MGFIIHFYITFGTNLLTQGPVQIAVFFAYFSVSQKRNIKRSPNGMKPSGELFLERKQSRRLGVDVREPSRKHYKDPGLLQQNRLLQYMLFRGDKYLLQRNNIRWQPLRLDTW